MQPAQDQLASTLEGITFNDPCYPVACNVDARLLTRRADVRDCLIRQVTGPVRWVECVQLLVDHGVTHLIELGPGKVLTGLTRQILGATSSPPSASTSKTKPASKNHRRPASPEPANVPAVITLHKAQPTTRLTISNQGSLAKLKSKLSAPKGSPCPPLQRHRRKLHRPRPERHPVSLADFASSPVVLFFYPRADTPGCTTEACAFRDAIADLKAAGVTHPRHLPRHRQGAEEVRRQVPPALPAARRPRREDLQLLRPHQAQKHVRQARQRRPAQHLPHRPRRRRRPPAPRSTSGPRSNPRATPKRSSPSSKPPIPEDPRGP